MTKIRLRYLATFRPKTPPGNIPVQLTFLPMEAVGDRGEYNKDSVRDRDTIGTGYTYFERGDVLRAKVTPCFENGKGAVLADLPTESGLGSTELLALKPEPDADGRYLYYCMQSSSFVQEGTASLYGAHGVKRVPDRFFRDFKVWAPPLKQQRAIAGYLDRETAMLDRLIAKKEHLARLLAQRAVTITNSEVFESAGPLTALSHLVEMLPGYAFESDSFVSSGTRLLRGINIEPGRIRWDDVEHVSESTAAQFARFALQVGDIVVGMDRPVVSGGLRVAVVARSDTPALLLQRVLRLRPRPKWLNPGYLRSALETAAFAAHLQPSFTGVSVPHISEGVVAKFRIPLPDLDTQRVIAGRLARVRGETESQRRLINRQVQLLAERRQAVITGAVMGQIAIPGAA